MPIFRVKSVKIYTGQKNLHGRRPWRPWQISGMWYWREIDLRTILHLHMNGMIWQKVKVKTISNYSQRVYQHQIRPLFFCHDLNWWLIDLPIFFLIVPFNLCVPSFPSFSMLGFTRPGTWDSSLCFHSHLNFNFLGIFDLHRRCSSSHNSLRGMH